MKKFFCIHGHFYQPPRDNPWLEVIELQDSAYPYRDWNERITSECYAVNATSRILDEEGYIVRIVNNYAKMSFDIGPTLLAWMERHDPDVYEAILAADRESQKRFSGHGSALAQAHSHMILPLANRRDKSTQIVWGIRDFEKRFSRSPEGMWLPETAVDLETLDIMAELGISFTILSPRQASRFRSLDVGEWEDLSGVHIDPTRAYSLRLPSGRAIALFFYDGPISHAVAFEGLLSQGDLFARRLLAGFSDARTWPQLMHIATDGETYGHHYRFGDMALAYAVSYIDSNKLARLTNYGEYLEKHPPTHEVEILENTSWSCAHGVERWRSNCGCNSGGNPEWNQAWRAQLRHALDWLRDTLAPAYENKTRLFLKDPWKARDEYIRVVLDRSPENVEKFFNEHASRTLKEAEKITVLKLLELQRHAMLMYTSCGWFFDDLSGIETVQVIQYAGRALQLATEVYGDVIEYRFLELLEEAKSNIAEHGDGRLIYEKSVTPAALDLKKVCAHYAVSSLFESYGKEASIFCYKVEQENYQTFELEKAKLAVGRVRLASEITTESARFCFGVLYWGDHNLSCCVRECHEKETYETLLDEIAKGLGEGDFQEALRVLENHLGPSTYSLKSLFQDEQRKILDAILHSTLTDAEEVYRQLYKRNISLLRFLKDLGTPPPKVLYSAAEFVLNAGLRRAFEQEILDFELIESLLEEAKLAGVTLHAASLEMVLRRRIEKVAERLSANPTEHRLLKELRTVIDILSSLPFKVNTWKVQNMCHDMLQSTYANLQKRAEAGEESLREFVNDFMVLSKKLSIRVDR
jgi:alpha-amylase/alpha-mannosidase (GH57 family)